MSEIKRYDCETETRNPGYLSYEVAVMEECLDGDWVKYTDYEVLSTELAEVKQAREEAERFARAEQADDAEKERRARQAAIDLAEKLKGEIAEAEREREDWRQVARREREGINSQKAEVLRLRGVLEGAVEEFEASAENHAHRRDGFPSPTRSSPKDIADRGRADGNAYGLRHAAEYLRSKLSDLTPVEPEDLHSLKFGPRSYTPEQAEVIRDAVANRKPLPVAPVGDSGEETT